MNHGKKNKQKLMLLILAIALVLLVLGLGAVEINRRDATRLKGYEVAALAVGLARAKEECRTEGLAPAICSGITGTAVANECGGKPCWIVHAHSNDESAYWASVTIGHQNGEYVVIDYLRDTGKHD